jgi:Yip1 domain
MNPELSSASTPASEAPTPPPRNFFSHLIGVWFSPGAAFAEVGGAPRVLVPSMLLAIVVGLTAYMLTERFGYENMVRTQMESLARSGWVPEDRVEEMIRQSTTPAAVTRGKIQGALTPVIITLVIMLIVSGLFKAFSAMMGVENSFKHVFSVTAYSFLAIALVHILVFAASIYLKDPTEIDLLNPVGSNIGAILSLMGVGLPKYVMGLASYIDLFGIWRLTLLAIGYSAVSRKMKVGTAATFLIILYVIGALIGAAMLSMFG